MKINRNVLDTLETALWCAAILTGVAIFLWVMGALLTISGVLIAGAVISTLSILLIYLAIIVFLYVIAKALLSSTETGTERLEDPNQDLRIGAEVWINLPGNEWHGQKGVIRSFNGLMVTVQIGKELREVYPRHLSLVNPHAFPGNENQQDPAGFTRRRG